MTNVLKNIIYSIVRKKKLTQEEIEVIDEIIEEIDYGDNQNNHT